MPFFCRKTKAQNEMEDTNLGSLSANVQLTADTSDVERAITEMVNSAKAQMSELNGDTLSEMQSKFQDLNSSLSARSAQTNNDLRGHIKQTADFTKKEIDGIDNALKKIAGAIGGYFAIDALRGYVGQIFSIRSQFASIEKSFKVLLGSEEKASKLFGDIKEFGATTPMNLGELASSAKMMLGFGIKSEDIMRNLRALGDVAMGDSAKFMSLSLAFSQSQAAGKLMGQDLLQMINAGFNPLETMAKTTGKSIAELKEEMSKGKISADMLRQAFIDATSEGGKYNGMLETQSKTLAGAYSNLQDTFDQMYNAMGEMIEDKMVDVIHFIEFLVQHYKEIAKVLAELTAAYGVYRAALWSITAVQKASAIAAQINAAAITAQGTAAKKTTVLTILLQKAQQSVVAGAKNILSMVNPYTLLAVAIAGVAYATYKVVTAETAMEKEYKKLHDIENEYFSNVKKEQDTLDEVYGKTLHLKEGTKEYEDAKQNIIDQYQEYLAGLTSEEQKLMSIKDLYEKITVAIMDKYRAQALEKARDTYGETVGNARAAILTNVFETLDKGKDNVMKAALKQQADKMFDDYITAYNRIQQNSTAGLDAIANADEIRRRLAESDKIRKEFKEKYKDYYDYIAKYDLADYFAFGQRNWFQSGKNSAAEFVEIEKAARAALSDAELMFGTAGGTVFGGTGGTTGNETTGGDNKAAYKKLEDNSKKYIEEYAKIIEDRNKKIKAINEDFELSQEEKNYKIANLQAISDWELDKLKAGSGISAEAQTALENRYQAAADAEVAIAKKKYLEIQEKIAALQKTRSGLDTGEKNQEGIAKYNFLTKQIGNLTAELKGYESTINSSFELSDYTKKADAYAKFAKEYTESLTAVQEKTNETNEKLKELDKQMVQATTPEQKADIQRQKENAQIEMEQYRKDQEMKRQILVESFDGTASDVTGLIDNMMKKVKDFSLETIRKEIINANATLRLLYARRDMGEDVSVEIAETEANLIALDSAAKTAEQNLLKANENFNKATWNDAAGAVDKLGQSFQDLGKAVGGSGEEALNALGSIMSTTATLIQNVVTFTNTSITAIKTASSAGVKALKTVEAASVILAIIGTVIQLINTISNLVNKKDPVDEMRDSLHNFNLELEEKKRLAAQEDTFKPFDTIFGGDKWGTMMNNIRIGEEALIRYNETVNKTIEQADTLSEKMGIHGRASKENWFTGKISYETAQGQYDNIEDTISNMYIKLQHKTWFRDEKGTTLGEMIPSLFGADGKLDKNALHEFVESNNDAFQKLSQENQDYLKEMDTSWQEYQKSVQEVKDSFKDFFGNLGPEIQDVWTNAFRTGQDGLADFEKSWDSAIENMITSMAYNKTIGKLMSDMENDLDKSGFFENPEGNLGAAIDIMESYEKKAQDTQAAYDTILQEYRDRGYFKDEAAEERKAVSGGITNMTQDTAEEMNGRLTQIQSHTFGISENMKLLVSMQTTQLTILQGIHTDTGQLHGIRADIAELKATVSDIQTRGLKLK